ncbi:MAG: signal peptidase II [Thermomicrobiales bacterium]
MTTHISAILVAVVVLDQVTKMLVVAWIGPDQPSHRWEIAGPWLAFEYIENTGAAFGMLAGQVWLLSILAIVVAAGFVLVFRSSLPHSAWLRLSLGLVIGGGSGNFLDRLRLGYVIDFLAIGIWPKFNLADSAISIGLVVLALIALREETSREHST